ncbi:NAD(P)-binding domain-containing protein [Sinomonas sp. R1AF57]|uniref:NAD(P)-binding domain-containing protein n=1 Tax=Sinomonas sp. R1AF57 TaxID=2020377 RepID=UPI000B61524F|nr:NAD(P)-binding domain-containing protein [Sinomonas sp. R1AF57]ASN51293.1 hypothetical protein CGQ25_03720 [Sinomonas sp. R1AF57]
MELIIGLGPIGANVGRRLVDAGREVIGLDLDPGRAADWANEHSAPAVSSFEDVPWPRIRRVIIAVRLAAQVADCFEQLRTRLSGRDHTVYVLTTLKVSDAKALLDVEWARIFEAPLSGGPRAAALGTMVLFVAGPTPNPEEEALLRDMAGRVFRTDRYGAPAVLKLANNALGAYNAIATATMLRIAAEHGVTAEQFLEIVNVSSGQSWMSQNFTEFHHDLLFKDAHLWQQDWGSLPEISLSPAQPELSALIDGSRALLGIGAHPAAELPG